MQQNCKTRLLLIAITIVTLAPFLNKAFHIDDPLFLWMAQQIARHPFDPYGFIVNWGISPEPMWKTMQNPPLCSYYIAAIASVIGWSEPALHCAFLVWPVLCIVAVFAIARRFCTAPAMAALATLFTPVFVISSTNVMCDVMLLALWLWSIECWLIGLDHNRWSLLTLAALLATAAALTKYFGIALVPLLAAYTIARDRSRWRLVAFLFLPVAGVIGFELWSRTQYGLALFTHAAVFSREVSTYPNLPLFARILIGFSFTGGCLVTAIFFLTLRRRYLWLLWTAVAIALSAAFYFFVPPIPEFPVGGNIRYVCAEGGLFAAVGTGILLLAIVDFMARRGASSLLLLLWLVGTFVFAAFCNWSITGRTILPMAPPAAILLMRRMETSGPGNFSCWARIIPAAVISLIITGADFRQANSSREAAEYFHKQFRAEAGVVWFQSNWGFQYYMQQWGASILDVTSSVITTGDIMIVPANHGEIVQLPAERVFTPQEASFSVFPLISTHGRATGAAFYTNFRGPLPWSIDHVEPEVYYVARFR